MKNLLNFLGNNFKKTSIPKCWPCFRANEAPKNEIHTKRKRLNSSDHCKGLFKTKRKITCIKTRTTIKVKNVIIKYFMTLSIKFNILFI